MGILIAPPMWLFARWTTKADSRSLEFTQRVSCYRNCNSAPLWKSHSTDKCTTNASLFWEPCFVYAWGTFLLITYNSNGKHVCLLNDTWNSDCVNQRKWHNLNSGPLEKCMCLLVSSVFCRLSTSLSISLNCRRGGESRVWDSSVNCCTIKGTIYPDFIPCIPTDLEHYVAVWSLHDSG